MLRRNRPDREPSVFRLGSIIVDLSSRRVEKGKEEIHLTSKESVSYTHLDVYKRQVPESENWPPLVMAPGYSGETAERLVVKLCLISAIWL